MSGLVTGDAGGSGGLSPAANVGSTVSAPATPPQQTATTPAKQSPDVGTRSLGPVQQPTTDVPQQPATPTPAPVETPQNGNTPQVPQRSSTIIPSIPIAPIEVTSSNPPRQRPSPTAISVDPEPTPEETSFQTIVLTTTAPPPPKSSKPADPKSSSSSAQPTLLSNGSPFGDPKGDQSSGGNKGKNSGATIAGVIGGLSAAILLGILIFFLWKWKTRGRYRFNKRQSFGPYGNGIDANRASEEPTYPSDDSPTRYRRPSFDMNREPTIPVIEEVPEPSFQNFSQMTHPGKHVAFENHTPPGANSSPTNISPVDGSPTQPPYMNGSPNQPPYPNGSPNQPPYPDYAPTTIPYPDHSQMERGYQPYREPNGVMPIVRPPPRIPPNLYERRRPPVPPSMRRNRSPPQQDGYDVPNPEMQSTTAPGGSGFFPRSNPMANDMLPVAPPMSQFGRHMQRSASLGGGGSGPDNSKRFLIPALDPMHPSIPEVPSGPSTPASESTPAMSMMPNRSASMTAGATRPGGQWSAEAEGARQALTVRNPGPPTPSMPMPSMPGSVTSGAKESGGKLEQLGNIVRRMSSKEGHHKVGDAAKNF